MSLGAAARVMNRLADASERLATNMERAAQASRSLPNTGSGSAGGGGGGSNGEPRGSGGGAGGNGGGGGSTGPLANREALHWLQRLWAVETERLAWEKSAIGGGTRRRISR